MITVNSKNFTQIADGVYIPADNNFGDKPYRLKLVAGRKVNGKTIASLSLNQVVSNASVPTKVVDNELAINIQISSQSNGFTPAQIHGAVVSLFTSLGVAGVNTLLSGGYPE